MRGGGNEIMFGGLRELDHYYYKSSEVINLNYILLEMQQEFEYVALGK